MGRRRRFSKDFKLEGVRLLDSGQKPAAQLALELGVRRNQLYKWKEQLAGKGEAAFRGAGRRPAQQEGEIARRRAAAHRLTGHFARPPVQGLDCEMDCRVATRERRVSAAGATRTA